MRRSPIVLTTTVAGLAGVLTFHAREPTLPTATAAAATTATSTAATAGASPSPSSGTTGTSGAGSSTSSTTARAGTFTGSAIDTRYGAAQVQVTIAGGRITDVRALQLQSEERKSIEISGRAAPLLRASALAKQTAAIDAVSGATITSASYEASLQSALDKAGFKAADGSRGSSTIPDVEEHDGGPGGGGFVPGG